VAPFQRVWNPDTNNVYEDPDDWPKESDDDDTITKDELYVSKIAPADARDSSAAFAAPRLQSAPDLSYADGTRESLTGAVAMATSALSSLLSMARTTSTTR